MSQTANYVRIWWKFSIIGICLIFHLELCYCKVDRPQIAFQLAVLHTCGTGHSWDDCHQDGHSFDGELATRLPTIWSGCFVKHFESNPSFFLASWNHPTKPVIFHSVGLQSGSMEGEFERLKSGVTSSGLWRSCCVQVRLPDLDPHMASLKQFALEVLGGSGEKRGSP